MKEPTIIAHKELIKPLKEFLGDQVVYRDVEELSKMQSPLSEFEKSIVGIWCTTEEWSTLSTLFNVEGDWKRLSRAPHVLKVELLCTNDIVSDQRRWPLSISYSPLTLSDHQIFERLLSTQSTFIQRQTFLFSQNHHQEIVSQVQDCLQQSTDNFSEMIAPMRALSKKFDQGQTHAESLCKTLLEQLENERVRIKEQREQLGTELILKTIDREAASYRKTASQEPYSLTLLIKETLAALAAPYSWFQEPGVDGEAQLSLESIQRGLKLLLSQLSLLDHTPTITLNVNTTTLRASIDIITKESQLSSPLSKSRFQSDIKYVRGIAEDQGGQLKVSSNLSGSLKISWVFNDVLVKEVTEVSVPTHTSPKSLIWLIDDEAGVRLTVKRWLKHLGYTVEVFEEGRVLLQALTESPRSPALIVCDADMPSMTGLEVLSQVVNISPNVKRLLYTAREPNRWVIEAFNQGVVHRFIDKSEGPEALKICLEDMLRIDQESGAQLYALDELLSQELIDLHLQPIFASQGGQIEAVEALMRSKHAAFRGPLDILNATQIAEREFDLQKVLTGLSRKLRLELPQHIKLFMNIDPLVFGYPDRLDEVFSEVYPYASSIVLELTERGQLCGDAWVESVGYLRAKGFEIALDDLGAGYNSLGAVAAVSPEIIKLDISLVSNLHLSGPKREMVRLLSEYAHRHHIKTVAEGIEVAEEAEVCTALGIKWLQGYHLARPMPLESLKDRFKDLFEA